MIKQFYKHLEKLKILKNVQVYFMLLNAIFILEFNNIVF